MRLSIDLTPKQEQQLAAIAARLNVAPETLAAHAALETFLVLNGFELAATVDDAEQFFLALAGGAVTLAALAVWIETHLVRISS